jgi:DNA-directed RNA polymerase specialized sigma24 family protein
MSTRSWPADYRACAEEASAVVFRRLHHRLRGRGLTATVAAELAAEAAQGAFVKVHRQPGFPGCCQSERHYVNWLVKVAYRNALDELRRKKAFPLPGADALLAPADEDQSARSLVWECLLQLPAPAREILLWYYYDGCTDSQIGLRLFPGQGTAAALGQRARKLRRAALNRLRALLLQRGVDPDDWPSARHNETPGRLFRP